MADDRGASRRNYLRAWREYRGLTQAQLAAMIGTEGSVISLLESGDRELSDKWLRRVAPALGTTPGFLLDYSPPDLAPLKSSQALPRARSHLEAASIGPGKPDRRRDRVSMQRDPYEDHDPRVDPGYDIPELWWKISDEDKPAALAALKALIPRN